MGGWANPLQPLPQGLVLTFDFDFDPDPELDNLDRLLESRVRIFLLVKPIAFFSIKSFGSSRGMSIQQVSWQWLVAFNGSFLKISRQFLTLKH